MEVQLSICFLTQLFAALHVLLGVRSPDFQTMFMFRNVSRSTPENRHYGKRPACRRQHQEVEMRFPKTALAVGALSIMTAVAPTAPAAETAIVNPPGLFDPAPNGFSHVVVVRGGGGVAYIAG